MNVSVKLVRPGAHVPVYMSDGAAGADLYASLDAPVEITPGQAKPIGTGVALEIPLGYAGFIYARSGLSTRAGLAPANKVGVIDSDYRDEVIVWLYNQSSSPQIVRDDDRIAQIVFTLVERAQFAEADSLSTTKRCGGFGSTGI